MGDSLSGIRANHLDCEACTSARLGHAIKVDHAVQSEKQAIHRATRDSVFSPGYGIRAKEVCFDPVNTLIISARSRIAR